METESRKLPPPPGLIASLVRGFDSVANHVLVILPPLLLDLFLWLGPHLRLKTFFQPFIDQLPAMAKAFPSNFPDLATVQQAWTSFMNQFNLFIILRTFPVGVTSLLSFQMPGQTPLGTPQSLDAGSFFGIIGWALLLALLGWVIGALYYYLDLQRDVQTGGALALEIHQTDHLPFDHLAGRPVSFLGCRPSC